MQPSIPSPKCPRGKTFVAHGTLAQTEDPSGRSRRRTIRESIENIAYDWSRQPIVRLEGDFVLVLLPVKRSKYQ
jgi:hypothetical protein